MHGLVACGGRDRLRTKIPTLGAPVVQLFGGNAQAGVLTKWLATKNKVLILDASTVGVDFGNNKEGVLNLHTNPVVRNMAIQP